MVGRCDVLNLMDLALNSSFYVLFCLVVMLLDLSFTVAAFTLSNLNECTVVQVMHYSFLAGGSIMSKRTVTKDCFFQLFY